MEDNIKKYPYFSDGEILTAGKLNNLTGFLHEQTASVSSNLIGYGIIRGFSYGYSKGKLTLYPGLAVFPDGTFYCLNENAVYPYIYQSEGGIFFSEKQIPNMTAVKPAKLPSGSVLALEKIEETVSNHCNQTSCDIYNPDKEKVVRVVLLQKSEVSRRSVALTPAKLCGPFGRLGKFHYSMNYRTLMKVVESRFSSDRNMLVEAMKTAVRPLGILITNNGRGEPSLDEGSDLFMGEIIPDWKSKANRYAQVVTKLSKLNNRGRGSVVVPPYFLSFLGDMRDALNEFIINYNDFVLKYKYCVLSQSQTKSGSPLILGELANGDSTLRTGFHYVAANPDFTADAHILNRMFTRILLISEKFIGYAYKRTFRKNDVQIIPSTYAAAFGDRPIPFYYRDSPELEDVWQAHRMAKVPETLTGYKDYVDGTRTAFSYGEAFKYDIQGVYDKNAGDVLSAVNSLISSNGLSLSARIITIPNLSMAETAEHPGYYRMILSAFNNGNEEKLNKFNIKTTKFNGITPKHEPEKYRAELRQTDHTRTRLLSLFKISDIRGVLAAMKNATPLPDSGTDVLRENLSDVSPHDFKMLYKYMKDNSITNRFVSKKMSMSHWKGVFWRVRAVAAFSKLRDYTLKTCHPELRPSVCEGVANHGTINLISYKGKVVFVCYS